MNGIKYKDSSLDTTNLIDYSTWTVGQNSATGFSRNGLDYENLIVSDFCPHGEIGPIWQAFNSDVDSNADGGWNISPSIDIDNSKTYRFSVWWKNVANATTNADGTFYHGVYGYNSSGANVGVYNRSNGAVNTNAYFYYPYVRELEEGTWYLTVGHIFPAGSGTGPRHEDSGLYTKYSGKNSSVSTLDFTWHENGSKVAYRTYLFNCNNPSTIVQFAYPRIEIVDGTEPTINQLLNGFGGYPVVGATQDGNFYVKTSGDMGPSEKTHYWSMIPVSGTQYALYGFDESVNKPRITVDLDSQSFITRINNLTEESITTISEAISWIDSNSKAHVDFIQTVDTDIYIDPTNVSAGRDGSISNPYNSFTESGFSSGNVYRLKAGTEIALSSELNYSGHTATFVGRYGTGADPKIKSTVSGTCAVRFAGSTACVLDHIDLYSDLSNSLVTLIQMGTGTAFNGGTDNTISYCTLHNVKQGTNDGGMGIRGGGSGLKILNTIIYDTASDGIYLEDVPNLEIGYCSISLVNQNYAGSAKGFNSMGTGASGDAIQLGGSWPNFHIHNTIIDRDDVWTGNKFGLILNSPIGENDTSAGIVEHCTFSMATGQNMDWMIYAEQGNGVIIRYNYFNGPRNGVRLAGAHAMNYLIHHNIFDGCPNVCAAAYFNGGTTGSKFYNNTCYQKTTEGTYFIWSDRAYLDVQNNIFYRSDSSKVALYSFGGSTWVIKNNCYNESGMAGTPGAGTGSVVGNPGFVDAANGNFHLQSTSVCRNAGIDVGIDEDYDGVVIPQETNPAIGTFEYVALPIYIDPTNVLSGRDGSIENPYNSFTESGFSSGNVYRLKAGTEIVLSSELNFSGHTATVVSRYGDGVDPKIKSTVSGTCAVRFAGSTACVLDHIDLYSDLSNSLVTLIQMGTGTAFDGGDLNVITNCKIHGAKQGTSVGGMGIRGGGTNMSILNNEIYDTGDDGLYIADTVNIVIGYNNIHHVNQNYAGSAKGFLDLGNSASGDGIQFNGTYTNYHVHNNIIDRTDIYTGNKYCLIQNRATGTPVTDGGIIEHNIFSANANVLGQVILAFNTGTIIRYNKFVGNNVYYTEGALKLASSTCINTIIHNNQFYDIVGRGISLSALSSLGSINTKIYNNVFYNFSEGATVYKGAIWANYTNPDVANNIFDMAGNTGIALVNYNGTSTFTIRNNCFDVLASTGTPGQGTNAVIASPVFADAVNKDFHLQSTSPCRNAGIDVDIDEDFDGVAIPQETYPAIGAYEYI